MASQKRKRPSESTNSTRFSSLDKNSLKSTCEISSTPTLHTFFNPINRSKENRNTKNYEISSLKTISCPICNIILIDPSTADSHVNSCLDKERITPISTSTSTIEPKELMLQNSNSQSTSSSPILTSTSTIEPKELMLQNSNSQSTSSSPILTSTSTIEPKELMLQNSNSQSTSSSPILTSTSTIEPKELTLQNFNLQSTSTSPSLITSWKSIFNISSTKNAFTAIMSGNSEEQKWKQVEVSEKNSHGRKKRTAPFYKILEGTNWAVDGFKYGAIPGIKHYVLTHFHSDHYIGLSSSWDNGPIYCSEITAKLVIEILCVKPHLVIALPMDKPIIIDNMRITLIDANHCPGAAIWLFETKIFGHRYVRYLHTGDFRAHPKHILHPALKQPKNPPIDIIYLDTTYLNPKYTFPAQEVVIKACAEMVFLKMKRVQGEQVDEIKTEIEIDEEENEMEGNVENDLEDLLEGEKDTGSETNIIDTPLKVEGDLRSASNIESSSILGDSSLNHWLIPQDFNSSTQSIKVKSQQRLLVIIGTYSIGKEKIVLGIAKKINSKIFVSNKKFKIYQNLNYPELQERLTNNPFEASIHVVMMGHMSVESINQYLEKFKPYFTLAIAFRPTGWTYKSPNGSDSIPSISRIISSKSCQNFTIQNLRLTRDSNDTIQCYAVPYSEHSSFRELTCFVQSLSIRRILPTVNNGSKKSRDQMNVWFDRWQKAKIGKTISVIEYPTENHW